MLARASSGERSMPALTALYDAIVRPVDAALAGSSRIVVVADPLLEGVPFAALSTATTTATSLSEPR